MNNETETLRNRIKLLEDENTHLKQLLREAGVEYTPRIITDNRDVSVDQARLFFSYFWGRTDVYAQRFQNKKTGKSGYFPQCNNFWRYGVCPKADRQKIQCKDCENKSWIRLGPRQIQAHLKGEKEDCSDVLGIYPLFADGTCRLLVFDFDNHNADDDSLGFADDDISWIDEVNALRSICKHFDIPVLVERSRSGKGAHLWIFFQKAVSASLARKFGFALLDRGAEFVNLKSFRYYDRMLPAQDELKNGGLGNLIALPLQGLAVRKGKSVFVDEEWMAYPDQWKALTDTAKLSEQQLVDFLEDYKEEGRMNSDSADVAGTSDITVSTGTSSDTADSNPDDKPWNRRKSFCKDDADGSINITLGSCIYIDKTNLKPRLQNQLRRLAAVSNPTYFKNNAMGLSNFNNSRYIYMGYDDGDYICVPRGLLKEIRAGADEAGIELSIRDERSLGRELAVTFTGQLREEQEAALEEVACEDTGIISAATAFGKTVVCSSIIAQKKVSTLILLESSSLIEQWQNSLEIFLDVDEELPEYTTPSGRVKRRKSHVGLIQGAKDTSTGIIDIAMAGSLKKKGEFHSRLKSYGMVIVDECHHSASDTMSEVLMEVNARYVYGVTATPFRVDGLEKINSMLLGPIRFRYTAREKAEAQGISHIVIPRFTKVVNPHGRDRKHVNDDYELIRGSAVRNEQICNDIRSCIADGRTPVVLSKYVDHSVTLYEALKNDADKVFLLTGALSKKQRKEIRDEMDSVSADKSMILIATGQLVGEGFDFPRLDTLILATPVAWKGLVEQYAGRLNRDYPGKKNVIIYDYIDSNIPVFDKMYAKRLRTYKRIGYSLYTEVSPQNSQLNAIYDCESYAPVLHDDLARAEASIVISSPFMNAHKVGAYIRRLRPVQERGVKITILTWDSATGKTASVGRLELIGRLREAGIEVVLLSDCHQHFAVIDRSTVWYGSMNLLGKEESEDNIMRIVSEELADEVLELGFGLNSRVDS